MSTERLAALPRAVIDALCCSPRGEFTAVMARLAAELEAANATAGAQPRPAPAAGEAAAGEAAGDADGSEEQGQQQQQQAAPGDALLAGAAAGDSAASGTAHPVPQAAEAAEATEAGAVSGPAARQERPPAALPDGPLPRERAAALAAAFLLVQPQMLIKSPEMVASRWAQLDAWLSQSPGCAPPARRAAQVAAGTAPRCRSALLIPPSRLMHFHPCPSAPRQR
jgi:hypothetical protein